MHKKSNNVKRINISLDKRLFNEIEKKRGMIPRSAYIRKMIINGLEDIE